MGKNVAVFVDVANIFYAAKAAGVDIDYVTLLKASSAGRDLVRAYAYTGLDPDNENQRNFHDFLRRHGYKVVSKDIRKYGDGKVKANLDIELVVDMMKTARNLDIAIVVSGDGDFAPAIRAVQEQGVRVEVVSFRGNTSSDLMDVADQFTDITQIAKVEKGSSRSGRRVADDDADLSMTEVPDKQSEGTGERSRGGRGRTRRGTTGTTPTTSRGRARPVAAALDDGEAPALVALPGEKLSRAAATPPPTDLELDRDLDVEAGEDEELVGAGENGTGEDGPRRRRRRGGRGRGRGRGREDGGFASDEAPADRPDDVEHAAAAQADEDAVEEDAPRPSRRAASTFGSVWDSQIGIPASRGTGSPGTPIVDDEEDFEEPAVPEYLIAERRRRDGGRGGPRVGGGRGRGGAYAAALDRERFGGGRGSTPSRFAEPPPRREGGFGRPDRGDPRGGDPRGGDRDRRDRQGFRDASRPPRGSGDEPWSEVPPEIEAMLRAQLASRPPERRPAAPTPADAGGVTAEVTGSGEAADPAPSPRRGRGAASTEKAPTSRSRRTTSADAPEAVEATGEAATEATAKPARRTTTRRATSSSTATTGDSDAAEPKPSARRTPSSRTGGRSAKASAAEGGDTATDDATASTPEAAPKRRTTRRKVEPAA